MARARSDSQTSAFSRDLLGRTLAGRYRITSALGRGGAGMVFLAVQEPLGRQVAVKILRSDLEGTAKTEFEARFLREAAVCGRLAHPNVVTVHDYGTTEDGLRYVVMERLTGPTLAALIVGDKALDPYRAARLVADLGLGLAAAHEAGLIHRDVKPHNVIVQQEDGRERPVLLDFGLAKVGANGPDTDSFQTRAGTYMGTPAYMAPEQAQGHGLDHRADIYALGCVLYRLASGSTPYDAEHPLGMAVQHMTQPYPWIRERAPDRQVPDVLDRIVERAMRKAPEDRYPTARALVADLEAFLGGQDPFATDTPPAAPRRAAVGLGVLGAGLTAALALVGAGTLAGVAALVWLLVPAAAPEPEPTRLLPLPMPVAAPAPAPAPAPPPAPPIAPEPAPVPAPQARPAPRPTPRAAVVVDEVPFTAAQAERALRFANQASPAELRSAGVYNQGVAVLLAHRPFASLDALGRTRGIGTKTMEALRDGAK